MPESTAPATVKIGHGAFCWHEVNTRDPQALIDFYTGLFGWTATAADMPGCNYWFFNRGEDTVAGLMEMDANWPAEIPAHWMSYVSVDDINATAASVADLGGTVCVPPTEVGHGTFAIVNDPQDGAVGLFTGGDGTNPIGEGCVMYTELSAPNLKDSIAFYEKLIGWTIKSHDTAGQTYVKMYFDDSDWHHGAMAPPPEANLDRNLWISYVQVADCDAVAARVTDLGGKVCCPPMEIPNVGRIAIFTDPHGATLAAWTPPSS